MFDDLKLNDMADSQKLYLCHPVTGDYITDSEGNKAWIELMPKESAIGRKVERKVINKRLNAKSKRLSTEELEDEATELLCALTVDWYLVRGNGEPADYPCDDEYKRKLYSDDSLNWIRKQADGFVLDLSNFFKG